MNQYTKGEWIAYCLGSEGYQVRLNKEGLSAAEVKKRLRARRTLIAGGMGGDFETQKANAQLISAAPDMYAALRKVRENIGHIIMTKADAILVDQIDKALTKAEGLK